MLEAIGALLSQFFIAYLALCLLVGFLGRNTRVGLVGTSLVSFLLTPVVGLLVILFAKNRSDDPA